MTRHRRVLARCDLAYILEIRRGIKYRFERAEVLRQIGLMVIQMSSTQSLVYAESMELHISFLNS